MIYIQYMILKWVYQPKLNFKSCPQEKLVVAGIIFVSDVQCETCQITSFIAII